MRRPAAGCSTLLLLLLALDAAQRQVLAAQLAVQLPLTDAGSAAAQTGAGAAFSERTPSEAAATGREQVAASQKASDQPGFTADCQDRCSDLAQQASPSQFQHPLAPPQQRAGRLVEAQAHVDMQRWLGSFFNSNASRLTSTRLQEARAARAAANASTAAAAAPGPEEASAAEGVADVVAPAGMRRCDAECLRAAAEEVLLAREQPGRALQLRWQPFEEDRQRWAPQAGHGLPARRGVRPAQDACQLRQPDETISRDFLVIAAVGNNWDTVNGWMSQPGSATFDVVLLHYGNDTTLDCPACAAVLRMAGPKWMLVWQLTQHPAWPRLAAGRRAVMVADDDVVLDTCSINRAFEVFDAYGLLLGQPSLCPTRHRPSWYLHLVRDSNTLLRFATMVEIMAPMFEMRFFDGFVRPSLHDAYTGWGLDFVWPFLLQFPRDRVAVIDDVCMLHPHQAQQKQGEDSIYAALAKVAPYDAREEEARRDAQFNYYPSELAALGFGYRPIEVVGFVPKQESRRQRHKQQQQQGQAEAKVDQRQLESKQAQDSQPQQESQQQEARSEEQGQPAHASVPASQPADPHVAAPAAAGRSKLQPWLLYAQITIMLSAVGMLVLWGNWQRRPASPRTAGLLQAHTKPIRVLPL